MRASRSRVLLTVLANDRDTLQRHLSVHDKGRRDRQQSRVKRACRECSRSKLRCDGHEPCSRCLSKNQPCSYDAKNPSGSLSMSTPSDTRVVSTVVAGEQFLPSHLRTGSSRKAQRHCSTQIPYIIASSLHLWHLGSSPLIPIHSTWLHRIHLSGTAFWTSARSISAQTPASHR